MKLLAALLSVLLAVPAFAGKLDLRYDEPPSVAKAPSRDRLTTAELWKPGNPVYLRGEGFGEQALAGAGFATLGAMGMAQTAGDLGKSREADAAFAGFGAMALINLWREWVLWRDPSVH